MRQALIIVRVSVTCAAAFASRPSLQKFLQPTSPPSSITARGEFIAGLRLIAPALPATAAWGLVTGVAMVKTGLTIAQALGMTLLVYAGSAQLAALPLIAAGTPIWVVLLTATIVNLRFVIYAATLSPTFRNQSLRWKLLLGYSTGDIGFVIFMPRVTEDPGRAHSRWLFLGIASANWFAWQVSSIIGIVLASQIPTDWGLELAGTIALLALSIPLLGTLPAAVGGLVTAALALIGADWPLRLGLVAAVAGGIAAALATEILAEKFIRTRQAAKR